MEEEKKKKKRETSGKNFREREKKKKQEKRNHVFVTDNVAIAQCALLQPKAKLSSNSSDKWQCQEDNYNRDQGFLYIRGGLNPGFGRMQ